MCYFPQRREGRHWTDHELGFIWISLMCSMGYRPSLHSVMFAMRATEAMFWLKGVRAYQIEGIV